MGVQKLYLSANTAPFTPTNFRGNWNDTAGAVTRRLDSVKVTGGTGATVSRAETSATNPYRVCLYRGVSGPLAAHTFAADSLDAIVGVSVTNTSSEIGWHAHAYITAGDTDTVRGTVLSDYEEAINVKDWTSNSQTKTFFAPQTTTSVVCSAGDRLVVELGYTARNSVTTSYSGLLDYGTIGSTGDELADQADNGPTGSATRASFISFTTGPTEDLSLVKARITQAAVDAAIVGTPMARITQVAVDASLVGTPAARLTQAAVEVLRNATPVSVRLTQALAEVARNGPRAARLTQVVVEVLIPNNSPAAATGGPFPHYLRRRMGGGLLGLKGGL